MRLAALLRSVLVVALACFTAGCEAMIPYNWDSAERDGERIKLVLDKVSAENARPMQVLVPREGKRTALQIDPTLIEGRIAKIVARAEASAERAPASWTAKTAADFYAEPPRLADPQSNDAEAVRLEVRPCVRGFRLERWLEDELVTTLEFSIEPVADSFRVTLERITMLYSRAKVADTSWINWWTRIPLFYGIWFDINRVFGVEYGDNAVDMQIDLSITSSWTDARGETHVVPISVLQWTVPDVPLGGKTHEIGQSAGWFPLPPASVRTRTDGQLEFGQGHVAFWVHVTEQDELAETFIEESKTVGSYFDDLLGLLPIPIVP